MHTYRETFRRHRLRYLLPPLLAALVIGGLSYKAPSYVSSASLWVDNQASSSSSLSVGAVQVAPQAPSAAEQTVLNELLTTSSFDNAVTAGAGLGSARADNGASPRVNPLIAGVTSTTPGPQVLELTATAPSPTIARDLVKSAMTQLQKFSAQWARQFASSAVAYYQAQVASANHDLGKAQAAGSASQGSTASNASSSALSTATAALSQAQAQLAGHDGFSTVSVLDQPTLNAAPTSGLRSPATKGLGAGFAAMLLSLLVIVMRTPGGQDRWDAELSYAGAITMGHGPLEPVTGPAAPAPVPPLAPADVAAPVPSATDVAPFAPGHAPVSRRLLRPGMMAGQRVMHQSSEHEPSPSAERGRA
jgi:hypothetical protein